jgi:ribonuclease HII
MIIVGVDEVGRGCLVGNVVAGAEILPDAFYLPRLTDSKKLSAKKRVKSPLTIAVQLYSSGQQLPSTNTWSNCTLSAPTPRFIANIEACKILMLFLIVSRSLRLEV